MAVKPVIERAIEEYLVEQVILHGGVAEKVVALGGRGFFDRLIVMPGGSVTFCEVKKPKGSRIAPHQILRAKTYRALSADVVLVKTRLDVDALLRRLIARA